MYYCPDQAYKAFIPGIPWETSTWVLFSSSSYFAPQKYFCGIKWDFDNLSWELDAAQIFFFLLQLTSLLKMGGDRIMRHSIRGSGSIYKECSSLAETPHIRALGNGPYCVLKALLCWYKIKPLLGSRIRDLEAFC